jgi:DNA-directed RNA polymerase subunit RPC12/RpoP
MPKVTYKCVDCGKEYTNHLCYFKVKGINEINYRCNICAIKFGLKDYVGKKITYKCVDCGKERTAYPSSFNGVDKSNYRCYDCSRTHIRVKKVTYKCIDCGKERSDYESLFRVLREDYRCSKCAAKKRATDPLWKENNKCAMQKRALNPLYKEVELNAAIKRSNDPVWKDHHKKAMEKLSKDPSWIENNKKSTQDPVRNEKVKLGSQKRSSNPIYIEHLTLAIRKKFEDPAHREKMANAALKKAQDPVWLENNRKTLEKTKGSLQYLESQLKSRYGEGIWYGNKYLQREYPYCELWNKNLWVRIDAAYDYKSIISGKDKFDNSGKHLQRHHVYWQPKACCIWDEDANGYYAWIVNGGKKIKYYIKGDPNKFVLLTLEEHGKMRGNKREGTDKIYWIKYLEDLIEQREKEGKKCYLSPEEYEVYKVEHKDIIDKYTK